ncbi:tRNA1(Val) (adenine(37)-N6)-methyltransferase [Pedobacter antarcticus]|uniref:tRNA1(Val) (adenine(37)-N6)-methyltransferase n=1 Tax=Pedobacter antarcticus TaxID=34086 RepID=UPI001C57344A|nr:methyltransferase [Pedobacter antarcticus]
MGSVFRFKQFSLDQQGCAMKINTDGVLLGAVACHDNPLRILDIGTGTGVIAMMLAQRFPLSAVDAVEIDPSAAAAAEKNFVQSPFADRVKLSGYDFLHFKTADKYDLIVSNPPFFVNDLKNPEKRKELARHADPDFFELMLRHAAEMMSPKGLLWLILPVKQADFVIQQAVRWKLYPGYQFQICSDVQKPAFRQLICLGFEDVPVRQDNIYIYAAQGVYTAQYQTLLKEFFLAF